MIFWLDSTINIGGLIFEICHYISQGRILLNNNYVILDMSSNQGYLTLVNSSKCPFSIIIINFINFNVTCGEKYRMICGFFLRLKLLKYGKTYLILTYTRSNFMTDKIIVTQCHRKLLERSCLALLLLPLK